MKVYCYSRCSTCQKALKYLNDNHIKYEEIDIKKNPPSYEELLDYFHTSNLPVKKFVNTSGLLYRSMNLKDKLKDMSDNEKLELLSSDGMLVKRPILVSKDKLLVGFKEKEWDEYFK